MINLTTTIGNAVLSRPRILLLAAALSLSLPLFFGIWKDHVSAQPAFPIIYDGLATIGGYPAPDGTEITARVGKSESRPVEVMNGKYKTLMVDTSLDYEHVEDVVGLIITFFANGIRAVEVDVFVEGEFIEKTLNLHFPELPRTGVVGLRPEWIVTAAMGGFIFLLAGLALLRIGFRRARL